ncbi:MAG: hypothetical protein CEO19_241 [Parcubacteria group bacterium Gr01-1014_73]|nr:MAG: hypothetical protein CEO19_241 [Parcubacteria group bacterium Gr01-1014_73]
MLETKQSQKYLLGLERLAQQGKYRVGLQTVEKYLKQHPAMDEFLLKHAFFLYHHAADLKYSRNAKKERTRTLKIINYFNQAIRVCRELIKRKKFLPQRIYLNARIYLAQIYAMLGKSRKAKTFVRATYNYLPISLTAERAADVYRRLNDLDGALRWHQRAVKKAKKADEKAIAHAGLAMLYRHMGKVEKAIEEVRIAIYFFKRVKHPKLLNPKLLIKILRSHIPELKKTTLLV